MLSVVCYLFVSYYGLCQINIFEVEVEIEVWCRKAHNEINIDFKLNLALKVKVNHPPKTTQILTKVFYTCGPNLVILAWTGHELSRRQSWGLMHTHGHTHRQKQATTIPKDQNWTPVKRVEFMLILSKSKWLLDKLDNYGSQIRLSDSKIYLEMSSGSWLVSDSVKYMDGKPNYITYIRLIHWGQVVHVRQ